MDNKEIIIKTLRSADKASVEKLMNEEAKKNEIFAKAQRRANMIQSEHTYSVCGFEQHERKINMTRIINIAASVALVTSFIGGGALIVNKLSKSPEYEIPPSQYESHPESETPSESLVNAAESETVTAANTEIPVTKQTTEEHDKSIVTDVYVNASETAAPANTEVPVTKQTTEVHDKSIVTDVYVNASETEAPVNTEVPATSQTIEEQNKVSVSQEYIIDKEKLIQKAKNNKNMRKNNYFDKFSADITVFIWGWKGVHMPETGIGKIYLDQAGLTALTTGDTYAKGKCIRKSLRAQMDFQYYDAIEDFAKADDIKGEYIFLETPEKTCYHTETTDMKISAPGLESNEIDTDAPENWEITGERIENGRRILSISGVSKSDNNYEGVYKERSYTAEVDDKTAVILSFDYYDSDGTVLLSYKYTNYKFDDDAVEFRTAADIIDEIKNGGYTME